MPLPILPILSSLGGLFGGLGGGSQSTDSNYESFTDGTSEINRTELPKEVLDALTKLTSGNLEGNFNTTQGALTGQLTNVQNAAANPFDVNKFVSGIVQGANNTIDSTTAQGVNLAESGVGASQGKSSMAALLASKLATDAASQKAGIQAQATAQGTQIATDKSKSETESLLGLTGGMNQSLMALLAGLRGAQTNQTQNTTEHTKGESHSTTDQGTNIFGGLSGLFSSFKMPT